MNNGVLDYLIFPRQFFGQRSLRAVCGEAQQLAEMVRPIPVWKVRLFVVYTAPMKKISQMATQGDGTVRFGQVLRGALQFVPSAPSAVHGLWKLFSLKPDNLGSIGASLAAIARRHPDRPALIFEGRRWTYAELNAWANRCAWALHDAGIRSGDSVGVMLENRAETLAYILGIVKLGAVAGLLNHQQRGEPLAHSLRVI